MNGILEHFRKKMKRRKSPKWKTELAEINPHAVGTDSRVQFSLSLFLFLVFIKNMSFRCKLGHRKNVLENFRKFISQERHIRSLIKGAYKFYFSQFWIIKVSSFKISKPDSVGVDRTKLNISYNPVFKFTVIIQHSEHGMTWYLLVIFVLIKNFIINYLL